MNRRTSTPPAWLSLALAWFLAGPASGAALLHVSFDITREVFTEINHAFERRWNASTGGTVSLRQSHGGSSKQARAVIDGLAADVVTMNQGSDLDQIARLGGDHVPADWRARFPRGSAPFSSTIVFLVRKGNPKGIHDWPDLVKPGVEVVFPNPKTSGNGRYSILAAYATELRRTGGDTNAAEALVAELLRRVPVLDTGGRGATATFVERGVGDVLLSFEAEVELAAKDSRQGNFAVVVPPSSIRADFPAAVLQRRGATDDDRKAAQAYVEFLFTPEAQDIFARHHFRTLSDAASSGAGSFPTLSLIESEKDLGGWDAIQSRFFAPGALLDRIQAPRR